ncbi:amidinotransferase [Terrimonas sp.]|uniref:citrulline utilization hydrolase CtlX n=1 Tax=Terrimonas sp. TaxID=1914338 RepID=UPI000D509681|nr:arginine deiminase-related protein [Terrimonas sp.]PVD52366.1 amidinotransferase [Terrimonas sp.]
MQSTAHILMIQPANFSFNAETAVNNAFQVEGNADNAQQKALEEFENFVCTLRLHNINVTVVRDAPFPDTPDSIFPNNWISFHGHTICLYPMYAHNRRLERKPELIEMLKHKYNIERIIDLTHYEEKNKFLEGTGSMVLDRDNRIAYACLSPRTDIAVLDDFCRQMSYLPVVFTATDKNNTPIYHTNVMMCVADRYVVVCLESIRNKKQADDLKSTISMTGKEIIAIKFSQVKHFAGNMLQVQNTKGEQLLVMSSQAYHSLTKAQIKKIEKFNPVIHVPLTTIETNGGGSARCMMAEIFTDRNHV